MLARQRVEGDYMLLYENYGISTTVFSPLKGGILTGKYNEGIPEDSRLNKSDDNYAKVRTSSALLLFQLTMVNIQMMKQRFGDEDWVKEIEKLKKLEPIAKKLSTDLAGLAMAWVLKNPNVASAITGASRVEQVGKSVRALDVVPKLTDEIMKEIEEILGNKPATLTRRF